jgi:hypothetical protein
MMESSPDENYPVEVLLWTIASEYISIFRFALESARIATFIRLLVMIR